MKATDRDSRPCVVAPHAVRLRVIAPEVGGGFGSKLNVYVEEALMGFIAMRIGKPVKWIESRRENFLCTIHGRGHVDYFELAAKRDGTMLGMKLQLGVFLLPAKCDPFPGRRCQSYPSGRRAGS